MTASSVIVRNISLAVAYTYRRFAVTIWLRYVESFDNFEGKHAWPALFEMSVSKQQEKNNVCIYIIEQRTIFIKTRGALATPRGQSLWILCTSTRDLWIWGWFCGVIWLRGGVLGTLSNLQIGTFLMELWWSGKLPEPPWSHLGSSWIISVMFDIFPIFVILDVIFGTFCHRAGSCWNLWSYNQYFMKL